MANTKKFSQFTNGNDVQVGDQVVGLRNGDNTRFDFPGLGIKDSTGAYMFQWAPVPSAVNFTQVSSSITGKAPVYGVEGSDTSIDWRALSKGSGRYLVAGSVTPTSALITGFSGLPWMAMTNNENDATTKTGGYVVPHYTISELESNLISGVNGLAQNLVNIGGGHAALNAATSVHIYAAADTTTTTGTEVARLDLNGLSFDGGANFIDDYEEGTWTPVLFGITVAGTNTYSFQEGIYTRTGNIVICTFNLDVSAVDAAMAGQMRISGLPFVVENIAANRGGGAIGNFTNITFVDAPLTRTALNTSEMQLLEQPSGGTLSSINAPGGIGASASIQCSISYQVS
jgi:hypothetical protein